MTTTSRRLPSTGFLLWGILPTSVALGALARDPLGRWSNALGAYVLAWWIVGGYLRLSRSPTLAAPLLLIALPWSVALVQTIRRVLFVAREGALDGPDGDGSPMAFLLGVVFELGFVFIPLTVIAYRLRRASRRRDAGGASDESTMASGMIDHPRSFRGHSA